MTAPVYLTTAASGLNEQIAALQVGSGGESANEIVATNEDGYIDPTLLPPGVGEASIALPTTEALAGPAMVNIWGGSGGTTPSVRNANATDATKPAQGFVLESFESGVTATVYFPGQIVTGASGLTIGGSVWLGATSGAVVPLASLPSASGNLMQLVGYALSATSFVFNPDPGTIHA